MIRGTENESAVLSAVRSMYFVKAVFEVGMLGDLSNPWLAASPDGVALLTISELKYAQCPGSCPVDCSFHDFASGNLSSAHGEVASLEIKTSVASSSLQRNVRRASVDVVTCIVGDDVFNRMIPKEHVGQMVQQMCVLQCHFSIYVGASQTGLLYKVAARIEPATLETCRDVLVRTGGPPVSWAHESNVEAPLFASSETKRVLESRLGFWQLVNNDVSVNGPLAPVKILKHGIQSLYSKQKGGVDGGAQYRAVMRSSTSSFRWEQKITWPTFKTL